MKKKRSFRKRAIKITIPALPPSIRKLIDAEFAAERQNNTPNNIMLNSLKEAYGINSDDRKKYAEFMSYLMRNLSLLCTGGKNENIFAGDFDKFIVMVIRSINGCGEMFDLLKRHGIEYTPDWLDEDGDDLYGKTDKP